MAQILYLNQYFTTTLSVVGGINDSQTTGIVLQAVSGLDTTKPGIALFNYADPLNTSIAEWIEFTAINSTTKTLTGVTRGAEGFSAKSHSNGVTVAFPISESHINRIAAKLDGTDTGIILNTWVAKGEYDNGNSGTSKTINWANGDRQSITWTGDCTITFSNAAAGQTLTLRAVQDATGSRTPTWPTLKWPGGSAGTPGSAANDINLYIFYFDGTNYLAQLSADFS
mgnify:CR=1 FL=1